MDLLFNFEESLTSFKYKKFALFPNFTYGDSVVEDVLHVAPLRMKTAFITQLQSRRNTSLALKLRTWKL